MSLPTLTLKIPAKVNWFLNIRGKRPDGYHELSMVMQAVSLYDRLMIQPQIDSEGDIPDISFNCNLAELTQSPEQNLVVKAYRQFWLSTGLRPISLNVYLEKNIPHQAGLGGGSADAAAMILALNHLTLSNLPLADLQTIGALVGSDVPFFISGGTALVSGRGETIYPLPTQQKNPALFTGSFSMLVLKPKRLNISTQEAYRTVASHRRYEGKSPEALIDTLLTARHPHELEPYLLNDFERIIFSDYPELVAISSELKSIGVSRPMLSGSGPSLIGFIDDTENNRAKVAQAFSSELYETFWVQPILHGIKQG